MAEGGHVFDRDHIFRCTFCEVDIQGKADFSRHIRMVFHPKPIPCGECHLSYHHLTSLIRHIKDVHGIPAPNIAERMDEGDDEDNVGEANAEDDPPMEMVPAGFEEGGGAVQEQHEAGHLVEGDDVFEVDLKKSAAEMILNLRQSGGITGSTIERFETECYRMMSNVALTMRQKVKKFLAEEHIDTPSSQDLLGSLVAEDPFENIRTLKQQLNYFAKEFKLVKPEQKFIDYRIDYRLNPNANQYEPIRVPMSFEYIPLIKTLSLILSNPRYRNLIAADRGNEDGVLKSYLDGRRAQDHPLVSNYPNILRLQLYWDDLEVVNPLGSKTTVHKLAAFYFSVQNMPPVESSQLSSVFLLALAFSEDLKGVGRFDKVLAPFLSDLRTLESDTGVMIMLDNEPFCLRATLVALCADTLAAHEILGFLSPSARHFCRKCMVSRPEFRRNLNAMGELRTKAMLEEQVQMVKERPRFATECGLSKSCPLHLLKGFDGSRDAVFDIFHDLLEGVCHWVISLALQSFITVHKYFSLENFNGRMSAFNYGVTDIKNKPSANFSEDSLKGSKLKQTGSQMWCLTRIFGFLVADIPEDDQNLKLVNILQSILLIVFADAVRPEDITKLERLIEEHHSLFQELHINEVVDAFPELSDDSESDLDEPENIAGHNVPQAERRAPQVTPKKIKPGNKLHHMKHYPEEIRDHGPLVRYWCARYEGRHHIFCKYGAVCCNFINVAKSMAQMFQISTLSGILKRSYRSEEMELQGSVEVAVEHTQHTELLISHELRPEDLVKEVSAIVIAGEDYRPGLFVLIDADTPTFALIQNIYVKQDHVLLILLPWRTAGFEKRYCAYRVEFNSESQSVISSHGALARHGAFAPWNPWNQRVTYVAPRSIIV